MPPAVETDQLTVEFGDISALTVVSLDIDEGEIFGLIGPNGAGKTTFVRSITGAIEPTAGSVRVFGQTPRSIAGDRIGLLPQSFRPPERLTGREIIAYYAGLYDDARSVESVLADVGMSDDADRWYERLSGGQQRRICVGTALVNDPPLLILDEPTTGIDPAGRRQLWSLFESLQRSGRTILLTTHDMAEAEALGDRIGLLDEGELITAGSPSSLMADQEGRGTMVIEPAEDKPHDVSQAIDRNVTIRNGAVHIDSIERREVPAVIDALEEADITTRRLAWETPSLEDVFFTLTEGDGE